MTKAPLSFAGHAGLSFGLRFGGLAVQFMSAILIARLLGTGGYGIYAYVFALGGTMAVMLGLGLLPLAVREVPRMLVDSRTDLARGFVLATVGLILASAVPVTLLLMAAMALGFVVLEVHWGLVVTVALVQALVLALSSTMAGFQRVVESQAIETVLRQGTFLALTAALLFGGVAVAAPTMIELSLIIGLGVILVLAWRISGAFRQASGSAAVTFRLRCWIIAGLPLMGVSVLQMLQVNVGLLVMGALSDPHTVALYRAASRGAELVIIANGIALHLMEPMLARALERREMAEAQALVWQSVLMSVALAAPFALGLTLAAPVYLGLFGPDFPPASPVLQLMSMGYLLAFMIGPVTVIMVMLNRERMVLGVSVLGLALNLGLCLTLVPRIGMTGAAIGAVAAILFTNLCLLALVRRGSSFRPSLLPAALWLVRRRIPKE